MTTDKMIEALAMQLRQETGDHRRAGNSAEYAACMNAQMLLIKLASAYKANRA